MVAAALLAALPARAQEGPVDLLSQWDIRIDGGNPDDNLGRSVADAGDVNNDGALDHIVGAPAADDGNAKVDAGRAYVIFGDPTPRTTDVSTLGDAGFRIDGDDAGDSAGFSVAGAGDVNDDGYDDVIVGALDASDNPSTQNGAAYVVFGKDTTTKVELGALGTGGFRIEGAGGATGVSVAGAGDVNNDGLDDVIVGAVFATYDGRNASGAAYVVFGKTTTSEVDLAASMTGVGFIIGGANAADYTGGSVSGGRDVNDDGFDDVVVGAQQADNRARPESGSVYVVFGKTTSTTIDTASLGSDGYQIDGVDGNAGNSVAWIADMNEDAIPEVLVGAPGVESRGPATGAAYVVFGQSTTEGIDIAGLRTADNGFTMEGAGRAHYTGESVAPLGDVNDDGLPDLAVGAPQADNNSRDHSGSVHVVFGKADTGSLNLDSLGDAGFRIDGAAVGDFTGYSVARAGDVDGDGFNDVLLGAQEADNNTRDNSGSAYVELVSDWLAGDCANPRSGTDGADTLIGGDAGDDISGEGGADVLKGKEGHDCVTGGQGGDEIVGNEGADILEGNDGADTFEGGDGADEMKGGDKGDTLEGGPKADTLDGGDGEDTLEAQDGVDTLKGDDKADVLKGGAGDDILKGQSGGDTLKGGENADTLTGGDGSDTIDAGGGADTIEADDNEIDTIDCGSGNDTVDADGNDILISC